MYNNVVNRNRIIYHYFQQLHYEEAFLRFSSTKSVTADLRCFSFYNYFRQSHESMDNYLRQFFFSAYFVNIQLLK